MSVLKITKENFQKEVIESAQPVLIDFWADWCGPCQMLSPVIDQIASERSDIKVGKINIDEELDLVTTPIGLPIKGETPAEIAISIAAQMILHRAERNGL